MTTYFKYVLICFTLFSCAEEESWVDFDYDQARAYHFTNEHFDFYGFEEVVIDGRLNRTITNPDGIVLTWQQIEFIGKALNGNLNSGEGYTNECYVPHHGIVFFKDNSIVAQISICFACRQIHSTPANQLDDVMLLKPLFQEMGFVIDEHEL